MRFGINDGHTVSGPGSGAVGIISESKVTREVGSIVRQLLKQKGHSVVNCTIDKASSAGQALGLITDQANRQDLDWFVSIHFNAGGGRGTEIYTYKGRQYPDAVNVCNNISKLGFKNRGVKEGQRLYVIRKTKAKSMLIEVCFVDTDDANKYLRLGARKIAEAIVNGICSVVGNGSAPTASNTSNINGAMGTCTGNRVRIRSTMDTSTSSNIIGHLNKGDKVKLFKDKGNGWYEIFFGSHGGFISSQYISL